MDIMRKVIITTDAAMFTFPHSPLHISHQFLGCGTDN